MISKSSYNLANDIIQFKKPAECNFLVASSSLPKISGTLAKFSLFVINGPLKNIISTEWKKKLGIKQFASLKIEEEPIQWPIYITDFPKQKTFDLNELIEPSINTKYKTISDYHIAFRDLITTPFKIAKKLLKLIEKEEIKRLNAILEYHSDEILKKADESTERYKNGTYLSIVDGVPFFVKEEVNMKGYNFKYGLTHFEHESTNTHGCIQKLLDKGAIMMGSTTMVQLGSNPIGYNPSKTMPSCRNPWNVDHYCGGSSSGSAAVVAAGLCPFSIGVDGFGSIRIPSGMVGKYGIRFTFGRVSNENTDAHMEFSNFKCVGPIACCVRDSLIVYAIMADPDERFFTDAIPPTIIPSLKELKLNGLKFGIFTSFFTNAHPIIYSAFESVLAKIKELGGCLVEIEIPELKDTHISGIIQLIKMIETILKSPDFNCVSDKIEDVSLKTLKRISSTIDDKIIENCYRQRARSMNHLKKIFNEVDIIISPNTATLAHKALSGDRSCGLIDEQGTLSHIIFMGLSSVTGIPSCTMGVGIDKSTNLPISIQLMSKWWEEDKLFTTAHILESYFHTEGTPQVFSCPLNRDKFF